MKKLLILLLLSISFPAFADSHLDFELSDFCYQQPNVQYRGGIYYFPNEEVGITATSICVHKDAYGQYESKGELNDGKFDGKWTFWYADGKKKNEINYVNGIAEGKEDGKRPTSWYENGQIKTEGTFEDGVLILETIYSYHENGQIKTEKTYEDKSLISETLSTLNGSGKVTSGQIEWENTFIDRLLVSDSLIDYYENSELVKRYLNGNLINKTLYIYLNQYHCNQYAKIFESLSCSDINRLKKASFENGKFTLWYENGIKKLERNYINGKLDGNKTMWFNNGQIASEQTYKNGKKDGKSTNWDKNGKLVSEKNFKNGYEIKSITFSQKNTSGQIEVSGKYKEDNLISLTFIRYFDNGVMWKKDNYNGDMQLIKSTSLYKNGNKKLEVNYKDGIRVDTTTWFKNGQKNSIILKNGEETSWYENGQKKQEFNIKNGSGKETSWYEDGQIKSERYYQDDVCISGDCE